jgi:hypothetical protein
LPKTKKRVARQKPAAEKRKGRAGRSAAEGANYDVLALRKKIGQTHGVSQISREVLANLLGCAVGSIVNWEQGMTPRSSYVVKLRELESQNAAGELHLTLPRGGRVPGPSGRATGVPGRRGTFGGEPSNLVPVVYANQARVDHGANEARIRFTLVLPGAREARAVADVVVPSDVISLLR